ncbi:hypothetical protein [Vibrio hepatarius]|uniref:hypothetical protein n=1 Tax=Vibrio hepatarius TaxID=171383 RepID=UPI001C09CC54|nr:hypothetical protein [Vibrio hepatarius]MBU2898625.1 hypothetical protein [Vibrio hepatarius]
MFKKLLLISFLYPCLAFANENVVANSNVDNIESSATSIPGDWTEYRTTFSRNEYNAFYQALDSLVGVSYTPFAVSTSVTAGMSYKFMCSVQPTYPDAPSYSVVIEVYQPINGSSELISINEIN